MIEVTTDAARRLVIARMSGMLSVAEVQAFSLQEQQAARGMGLKSGEFDLLVIADGTVVQTQDVINAFAGLILHSPMKSRRFATVRDGALPRIQTRRLSKMRSAAEIFCDVTEADAWLAACAADDYAGSTMPASGCRAP